MDPLKDQEITTPSAEGTPAEPGAQETVPGAQVPEQPQDAGQIAVDNPGQPTSSEPPAARPKSSEFYLLRQMKKNNAELLQRISRLEQERATPPAAPAKNEFDQEALERLKIEDPFKYMDLREKQIEEKFNQRLEMIKQELPANIQQLEARKEFIKKEQEALEKLFPKDPGNTENEEISERLARDPERARRIQNIIVDYGLAAALQTNPDRAANGIMEIYERKYPRTPQGAPANPAAPSKQQLGSIAGGRATDSTQNPKKSLADVQSELNKLGEVAAKEPWRIAGDPEYQKKKVALESQYNALFKVMSGR